MGSVKIIVHDYRIIKDAKLIIDGIIGIVGENNNGKSCLFRSVKTICYNIGGGRQIRDGEKSFSIGLAFDDPSGETKIVLQKAASPTYLLNGVLYEKTGRAVPPEIEEALNMSVLEIDDFKVNLNFLDQMQEPILQRLSEYQLYNVTIKSFDGEKINDAVKKAKKESDEYREHIKDKSIEIDVQKKNRLVHINKLTVYDELSKIKNDYLAYEAEFSRTPRIEGFHNRRVVFQSKINSLSIRITEISKMVSITQESKALEKESHKDVKINNTLSRRNQLKESIRIYNGKISVLSQISGFQKYIKPLEKDRDEIERVVQVQSKSNTLRTRLIVSERIFEIVKSINRVSAGFSLAKNSVKSISVLENYKSKKDNLVLQKSVIEVQIQMNNEKLSHLEIQQKGGFVICNKCNQKIVKPDDMKFDELKVEIEALQTKHAEFEGSVKTIKKQLEELDEEIKKEGWNPEDLAGEIEKSRTRIAEFEKKATPIVEEIKKNLLKAETAVVAPGDEDPVSHVKDLKESFDKMENITSDFDKE